MDQKERMAWALTQLSPEKEKAFQWDMQAAPGYRDWYRGISNRYGETPNLNDQQYDYRGAWQAGVAPQPYAPDGGLPHWPSRTPDGAWLKGPDHPTAWMETFMNKYGTDPNEATQQQLADALASGIVPIGKR